MEDDDIERMSGASEAPSEEGTDGTGLPKDMRNVHYESSDEDTPGGNGDDNNGNGNHKAKDADVRD